jgi:hypothetical protein
MAKNANRAAYDTGTVGTTSGSTTILMVGFASLPRRCTFVQQRLALRGVEETGLGIAMLVLPAGDDGSGGIIELASDLEVKSEP